MTNTKPNIIIYATGGTISGSSDSNLDTTNYKVGQLSIESLITVIPELNRFANVSGVQFTNTESNNITKSHVLSLSKTINQQLADNSCTGVVITHGTDTLEETAFFLDITISSHKPVVVVGSMRPATAMSADGNMNLLQSVKLASADTAVHRGTMIVLNDRIGSAFYTTKTHSTALDTFKSTEQGYLGIFLGSEPYFYYQPSQPTNKPYFDISKVEQLPKVLILYSYQDEDGELLKAAIANGAQGIVIAGSGNGSIPEIMEERINEAMAQGIPVVLSTRTGNGFVSPKRVGIGAGVYNPQKAKVVLELALAEGYDINKIRRYFEH